MKQGAEDKKDCSIPGRGPRGIWTGSTGRTRLWSLNPPGPTCGPGIPCRSNGSRVLLERAVGRFIGGPVKSSIAPRVSAGNQRAGQQLAALAVPRYNEFVFLRLQPLFGAAWAFRLFCRSFGKTALGNPEGKTGSVLLRSLGGGRLPVFLGATSAGAGSEPEVIPHSGGFLSSGGRLFADSLAPKCV